LSSHGNSRGIRCLTEFTFQVATAQRLNSGRARRLSAVTEALAE
jgi:hypothetical protein